MKIIAKLKPLGEPIANIMFISAMGITFLGLYRITLGLYDFLPLFSIPQLNIYYGGFAFSLIIFGLSAAIYTFNYKMIGFVIWFLSYNIFESFNIFGFTCEGISTCSLLTGHIILGYYNGIPIHWGLAIILFYILLRRNLINKKLLYNIIIIPIAQLIQVAFPQHPISAITDIAFEIICLIIVSTWINRQELMLYHRKVIRHLIENKEKIIQNEQKTN